MLTPPDIGQTHTVGVSLGPSGYADPGCTAINAAREKLRIAFGASVAWEYAGHADMVIGSSRERLFTFRRTA